MFRFNFIRFLAILRKEFIQMRRDRLTFAMMFGIPIIQLILFGFAINTDPKDLPAAARLDNSPSCAGCPRHGEQRLLHIVDHVGRKKLPVACLHAERSNLF
jgi:hypothetical protein